MPSGRPPDQFTGRKAEAGSRSTITITNKYNYQQPQPLCGTSCTVVSHHQPSTRTTQEQAGTSSSHAARSFAASRPPGLPPCSSQRGSAVRGPPPTATQGERTEDSHKLASDPVQKEPGAWRESKLQAGDGSVDDIGTSDLIPRAAGRGVLKCDCTHHLTQGWRPSRSPNPGVRESHCGHGSKPPGLEPTRHSPNSPLTGNVVEAKSQIN